MKTNNTDTQFARFTLAELLIYISVFVTMTSFLLGYFHSTVQLNRQAVVRAHRYQMIKHIRERWTRCIAEKGRSQWQMTGKDLACETVRIVPSERHIVTRDLEQKDEKILLPRDCTPSFSIESEDRVTRIVLTLSFPSSKGFRPEAIRLVAVQPSIRGDE